VVVEGSPTLLLAGFSDGETSLGFQFFDAAEAFTMPAAPAPSPTLLKVSFVVTPSVIVTLVLPAGTGGQRVHAFVQASGPYAGAEDAGTHNHDVIGSVHVSVSSPESDRFPLVASKP